MYLEVTGRTYVSDAYMVPDIDRSSVEARIRIGSASRPHPTQLVLQLTFKASARKAITVHRHLTLPANEASSTVMVAIPAKIERPVLWELDDPQLYEVQVTLAGEEGVVIDSVSTSFGMRKIEARGKHFYLNNRPIYLVGGWLDQSPLAGPDEVNWALPPPSTVPYRTKRLSAVSCWRNRWALTRSGASCAP